MTLPASGPISLNQVNVELGLAGTTSINMNQASVRTLFGVPSGAISMSNGYGKSNQFAFTISSNQTNANLRTLAVNAGWNQSSRVVATINGGVYCTSNSTGTPALTVNGAFPGGVSLVNNGLITGMGGAGARGRDVNLGQFTGTTYPATSGPGGSGGLALSVSSAISITNNGTISGGGGGGGGGGAIGASGKFDNYAGAGGGGGGGRSGLSNSSGGPGGAASGKVNGTASAGGAGTSGSQGGGGGPFNFNGFTGGPGGSGGAWGSAGSGGGSGSPPPGGPATSGGAGGGAVTGNSNITWVAFGTRNGGIS